MQFYRKYFRVKNIDILVYRMSEPKPIDVADIGMKIQTVELSGKKSFSIKESGKLVHNSFLFKKAHVLRLLGKKGPVIGDCVTSPEYRGRSIYPFVINKIALESLKEGHKEVFVIVNSGNQASIRGIEKAGFHQFAHVKAKRFLFFYFGLDIQKSFLG